MVRGDLGGIRKGILATIENLASKICDDGIAQATRSTHLPKSSELLRCRAGCTCQRPAVDLALLGAVRGGCDPGCTEWISGTDGAASCGRRGRRPILVRWRACANRKQVGTGYRGKSALRSALLILLGDEISALNHEEVLKILWDLEKFYDTINISLLIDRAFGLNYPIGPLALGIQMHMAPRCITALTTM